MPRVVGIVQARTGSSRLPWKTMADIEGKPMLLHVVERLARVREMAEVVIATSANPMDWPIADLAERVGMRCVRGSEDDVLARYCQAAREADAEIVVRFTADCPLLDPELSGDCIRRYIESGADFAANCIHRTFPRGAETEVFSRELLERIETVARAPHEREHVTAYFYLTPGELKILSVEADDPIMRRPDLRLCVDTSEDLRLMREIYARLGAGGDNSFSMRQVIELINREPHLAEINRAVKQRPIIEKT